MSASVSGGGVVLYGLHTVLVDLFELRSLTGLPSTVPGPGALVAAVWIFFVSEAGFPDVRHDVVDVTEVSVFGSSGHPERGSGPKGFESSTEGDDTEELFVAGSASMYEYAFSFPIVFMCDAHNVGGSLKFVFVGESGTCSADGGYGELLVGDLVMLCVVLPGSVLVVACPFYVVEEPAKWFPPDGFERDLFVVVGLVLTVEVVVCDLDPCLREVAAGDCFRFEGLRGEGVLVGREMVKSMFLDVVSRVLCACGHVWCGVVVLS